MTAYYNEIDLYCAQWLRNLIAAGHIAPGDVDTRSIVDVKPDDLRGYTQCHFFAGIGGWSYALRLAGWGDDRPVWTGSCPCQPFSSAGAGKAANDSRHLWPVWFPLIRECTPPVVFGEQVEAAIGWGWLDAVYADMEAEGYACGEAVLPACSVGAFHIRTRLWFVAHADGGDSSAEGLQRSGEHGQRAEDGGAGVRLADATSRGFRKQRDASQPRRGRHIDGGLVVGRMGDTSGGRFEGVSRQGEEGTSEPSRMVNAAGEQARISRRPREPGAAAWSGAEWIHCTDGKSRPVEPGTFPLAHGVPRRTSKLRAYGNAIVPQVAAEFIRACNPPPPTGEDEIDG